MKAINTVLHNDKNNSLYQDNMIGLDAYVQAAKDLLEGKIVIFYGCTRDPEGLGNQPVVKEIFVFGMGKDCPRYVGEDMQPDGPGSHSLIASWYPYCKSESHIAVALVRATNKWRWVFREKDN